jgi:glucokinase
MAPITLLAGDLGGTKTLLATYQVDGPRLIKTRSERYASGQWPDFSGLVAHFLAGCEVQPSAGCLAVAGPVHQGRVKLTNLPWQLDEDALGQALGLEQLELVNDFAVLIYGLPHLAADQQAPLWQPAGGSDPLAPVAILGAGTGLGVALGVPTDRGLVALATEASHAEFAPRNRDEWELKQWLIQDLGLERVSIERIVSGTGLGEVMRWVLCCNQASDPHHLATVPLADLPERTHQSAAAGDPLAHRALSLWLGAYGSAAGDLVLQSLCLGGLWVGGGTAAKLLPELASARFLDPLLAKGRMGAIVQQVPIQALIDPEAGLFSAACRARMLLA